MTARRRCGRRAAALAGVGLVLLMGGRAASGQEPVVAEPTTLPPTTLAPTTTLAATTTTAPVTTITEAVTTTTVTTPTTTAESATTTTGVEPTTTTTAEGTASTSVTSTSVPTTTTTAVARTTRRDAELARGRAVAVQRDARARQVGGVVEPTDDAPDLGSLFDRAAAPRGRSTQERSGSGLFFAGLAGAVVAGLTLGLRDRSVTLRAEAA